MKTDFPILWVDDNKDYVDSLKPQLEKWMEGHGFELIVHWHRSEPGVMVDLKNLDIELVVIDFNLPGKKNGDDVIKDIRKKGFYHDIVFYSQGGKPAGNFASHPDGVFFVSRADAKDRIKDLVELKLKRSSDLATLRGWIVADAIELENLLNAVLAKCFKDMELRFTTCVLQQEGLFDFYKKHKAVNSLMHDIMDKIKDSNPESQLLANLKVCKKILDAFPDEIVHVRNALAHQIAETDETGQKVVKTKGKAKLIPITPEQCIQIRNDIRKHRANLLKLASLV